VREPDQEEMQGLIDLLLSSFPTEDHFHFKSQMTEMKRRISHLTSRIEAKADDLQHLNKGISRLLQNPQVLNLKTFKPKQFLLLKAKDPKQVSQEKDIDP
jgi:hypothetical protein